jgi:hypothetical protein
VVRETGWSMHDVLWAVSWTNVMMMMVDRPTYQSKSKPKEKELDGSGLADILRAKAKAK